MQGDEIEIISVEDYGEGNLADSEPTLVPTSAVTLWHTT